MFCKFCGTKIPMGVSICPACQKPVLPNMDMPNTNVSGTNYIPKTEKNSNIGIIVIGVVLLIIVLLIVSKALNIL